jgi:UDP-N-acetylglucosamine 2-epimerase (non-hydrolysing)/GDP/UDP-N,N'-diacetylbacillosamine 2-epimerase (hydrolysing)
MASTLRAIENSASLQLQLIATGMHLDPKHGQSVEQIAREGWKINAIIAWPPADEHAAATAAHTGNAIAELAAAFDRLNTDIVLIVGDRVEAFAAAAAGCLSGRIVAHVHGGDRALGQLDDSLRHAITKLAHLHFPATEQSAERIAKLGENRWRIHRAGSPGIDGIRAAATARPILRERYGLEPGRFALLLLHPTAADPAAEHRRAQMLLRALRKAGPPAILAIASNNDAGSEGILRCWERHAAALQFHRDLPRADFLGLLRDAAFLVGNSSSGIIEAASFGTPVIDIGDRQKGRERGGNVRHVPFTPPALCRAIAAVWRHGRLMRFPTRNIYGGGAAGAKIARALATAKLDDRMRRKLIAY